MTTVIMPTEASPLEAHGAADTISVMAIGSKSYIIPSDLPWRRREEPPASANRDSLKKILAARIALFEQMRCRTVGQLPKGTILASGSPTIHRSFVFRSIRRACSPGGCLLRAPWTKPDSSFWTEEDLPPCRGGRGMWSKRISVFSSRDRYLYLILTEQVNNHRDTPPSEIFCLDAESSGSDWTHVTSFSRTRLHFGAVIIPGVDGDSDKLVIIGGCQFTDQNQPMYLKSAEFVDLNGRSVGDWRSLPDVPVNCRLCRLVLYHDVLCLVGTVGETFAERTKVLTLPLFCFSPKVRQAPDVARQDNLGGHRRLNVQPVWRENDIPDVPNANCGLAVFNQCLIAAGGRHQDGSISADIHVFNPCSTKWEKIAMLSAAREFPRLLSVNDSSLLVLSGRRHKVCERSVEQLELLHDAFNVLPRCTSYSACAAS